MISTILLSGGIGSRSGKDLPKQYSFLLGKRIINYCLDSIYESGLTDELIIVYGEGFLDLLEEILSEYKDKFSTVKFVLGGSSRQESVFNGLKSVTHKTLILHEAARPLVTSQDLKKVIFHPAESVTMGLDIPFTVLKQQNGQIVEVLERSELFNVQLPQKFNSLELLEAHRMAANSKHFFTDDSSLLFKYNGQVKVIKGSHENIKITTPGDFTLAENILQNRENKQEY